MKNNLKRILSLLLCLSMMVGMLMLATSCGKDPDDEDNDKSGEPSDTAATGDNVSGGDTIVPEVRNEGEIAVLKVLKDIEEDEKLTVENIGIGYAIDTDIPLNAVLPDAAVEGAETTPTTYPTEKGDKGETIPTDILGKVAKNKLYAGEYVFRSEIEEYTDDDIDVDAEKATNRYIVVEVKEGQDASTVIQNLIDKNAGKTLYFPDGKYVLSKPIQTSAAANKKVSFELSSYAIFEASDTWKGDALVRIGAKDKGNEITSTSFKGGIINPKGKANGISVEGGRDTFIFGVSIKNSKTGIVLAESSEDTTVKFVDIKGNVASTAIGVQIDSKGNTIANVTATNVKVGYEVGGSYNFLMNAQVSCGTALGDSYGFYDKSGGHNLYENCISRQMPIGFRFTESSNAQVFSCMAYWSGSVSNQTAFKSDGKLNAQIRDCKVVFGTGTTRLVNATSGGGGKIEYPMVTGNSGETSGYVKTSYVG